MGPNFRPFGRKFPAQIFALAKICPEIFCRKFLENPEIFFRKFSEPRKFSAENFLARIPQEFCAWKSQEIQTYPRFPGNPGPEFLRKILRNFPEIFWEKFLQKIFAKNFCKFLQILQKSAILQKLQKFFARARGRGPRAGVAARAHARAATPVARKRHGLEKVTRL